MAHLSKKALVGNHTSLEYLDTWQLEVNRGNFGYGMLCIYVPCSISMF